MLSDLLRDLQRRGQLSVEFFIFSDRVVGRPALVVLLWGLQDAGVVDCAQSGG